MIRKNENKESIKKQRTKIRMKEGKGKKKSKKDYMS
jgi:hypothetical protein